MNVVVQGLLKSASRLVDVFGIPMTLSHVSSESYDVASGTTTQVKVDLSVVAVTVKYGIDDIDGESILRDDRKMYIKAEAGKVPAVGDTITGLDAVVKVVSVHSVIKTATDDVIHICQVRG